MGGLIILVMILGSTWSYQTKPCALSPMSILDSQRRPLQQINDLTVQISSPECDSITLPSGSNPAEGSYSGNLSGREIWILVYGPDLKYYPQSAADPCQAVSVQVSEGYWRTNLFLGIHPPQQFDIVATVTDIGSEASLTFKQWLKTGCNTNEFPGFSIADLPQGLTEMDVITVKTK